MKRESSIDNSLLIIFVALFVIGLCMTCFGVCYAKKKREQTVHHQVTGATGLDHSNNTTPGPVTAVGSSEEVREEDLNHAQDDGCDPYTGFSRGRFVSMARDNAEDICGSFETSTVTLDEESDVGPQKSEKDEGVKPDQEKKETKERIDSVNNENKSEGLSYVKRNTEQVDQHDGSDVAPDCHDNDHIESVNQSLTTEVHDNELIKPTNQFDGGNMEPINQVDSAVTETLQKEMAQELAVDNELHIKVTDGQDGAAINARHTDLTVNNANQDEKAVSSVKPHGGDNDEIPQEKKKKKKKKKKESAIVDEEIKADAIHEQGYLTLNADTVEKNVALDDKDDNSATKEKTRRDKKGENLIVEDENLPDVPDGQGHIIPCPRDTEHIPEPEDKESANVAEVHGHESDNTNAVQTKSPKKKKRRKKRRVSAGERNNRNFDDPSSTDEERHIRHASRDGNIANQPDVRSSHSTVVRQKRKRKKKKSKTSEEIPNACDNPQEDLVTLGD